MIAFPLAVPAQQRPDLPLVLYPQAWCIFSTPQWENKERSLPEPTYYVQHYRDSCKNSIRQNQRAGEEDFSGMREVSGNPLVSAFGAQPSGTWCPNQDSCGPRCRVQGPCGSHPVHTGLDPVPRDPMSALHLCVSCPLEIPNI